MQLARSALRTSLLAGVLWLLGACAPRGPRPIDYGRDACDYCRMVISDGRYGAELVTAKGKVHTFDSIECLATYYMQLGDGAASASVWVSDFAHPGTLLPAETARFVRAPGGPGSPMGRGLAAFAAAADTATIRASFAKGATLLRWEDVLALIEREGLPQGAAPDRHTPTTAAGGEHVGAR